MSLIDLPAGVQLIEGRGGLPMLRVATAACTGEVYLQGAHVAAWTPAGAEPVIWMSGGSRFVAGEPIRGGIPVCFPWFGPGLSGDQAPGHGFARLTPWDLIDATDADDAVTLTFKLTGTDATGLPGADDYPTDLTVTYDVTLGSRLELKFTVTAGAQPVVVEEALHSYLAVGDIRTVRIEGLDGAPYLDKVAQETRTQAGDVTFSAETDRVYASTATVSVHDDVLHRVITIEKSGSASTVIWNPWAEKAASMPDYLDDEWPGMVCVETANALDDALHLEPAEVHTLTATISVSSA